MAWCYHVVYGVLLVGVFITGRSRLEWQMPDVRLTWDGICLVGIRWHIPGWNGVAYGGSA